ncbi:MAG: hypothetical protein A2W93_06480 [Bacteroidetes bacterium GWF2_43_63]|nr:MAG: hypothetical protein A2W94_08055 [Bacteroidetes bacterium GWE2_42_42]OFY53266.1 MAG: hypothetical protein A2W93_06480 [Bacteroidetes bacterium GWF2_43_63]HBG71741.1 hypothetical protein [Bacteroidales bacterium]HCB61594.1 hypothetical protein [Bacteroidales bacterium]HCY22806.1 hypothetical protein [Bacteroidales bacterium]
MKNFILLLWFVVLSVIAVSQNMVYNNAYLLPRNQSDNPRNNNTIYVDHLNRKYAGGGFTTFYQNGLSANAVAGIDGYCAELDDAGNVLWFFQLNGSGNETVTNIISDDNNCLYLLGTFDDTLTVDTFTIINNGIYSSNMFIVRLDPNRNVDTVWCTYTIDAPSHVQPTKVCFSPDYNTLYISGYCGLRMSFDSIPGGMGWDPEPFLAAFSTNPLKCIWLQNIGVFSYNESRPIDMFTDNDGNVYVAGSYYTGGYDIHKFTPDGMSVWSKQIGGNSQCLGTDNRIYVGRSFSGSLSFGSSTLTSVGGSDIGIFVYDTAGTPLNAHSYGALSNQIVTNLTNGFDDKLIVSGETNSSLTLDTIQLNFTSNWNFFTFEMDTAFNVSWAASGSSTYDWAGINTVLPYGNNKYFVSGYFQFNLSLPSGTMNIDTIGSTVLFAADLESYGFASSFKGKVTYGGSPVDGALVKLFQLEDGAAYLRGSALTDAAGNYQVSAIDTGEFVLSSSYMMLPVTYYENAYRWDSAQVFHIVDDTIINPVDILFLQSQQMSGTDSISGHVNLFSGEPVFYMSVFLTDLNGSLVSFTRTDSLGYYMFENVDAGSYMLFIDTAGMELASMYYITIGTKGHYSGYDFIIGSDGIIYAGIEQNPSVVIARIFPNPANEIISVVLPGGEMIFSISVFNMSGTLIRHVAGVFSDRIDFSLEDMAKGVYNCRVITSSGQLGDYKIIKL